MGVSPPGPYRAAGRKCPRSCRSGKNALGTACPTGSQAFLPAGVLTQPHLHPGGISLRQG
jgi:hypothetical protein